MKVKAYAGTTGIMLCFDIAGNKREGLLGFAVSRISPDHPDPAKRGKQFLKGALRFPDTPVGTGEYTSDICPIQKFRWSDYTVYPGQHYTYEVHPVRGTWDMPELGAGMKLAISSHGVKDSEIAIFNRAVVSSQAFSRKFPDIDKTLKRTKARKGTVKDVKLPEEALDWLSRGLTDAIKAFLERAKDKTYGLDIAIYEYHLPLIAGWVKDAHDRGVNIRLVFHDKGDATSKENRAVLKEFALPNAVVTGRKTKAIMHNKYAILHKMAGGERKPVAVLCGSTNWTENGNYRQANVVHVTSDKDNVAAYAQAFETLLATAAKPADTKTWITANNPMPKKLGRFAGFSPRRGNGDLEYFVSLINACSRDVLFSTAFDLKPDILKALLGKAHDTILRLGLQNSKSEITGIHRDRTASFTATALLPTGLEGWLKETMAGQKGNIRIHTKAVVTDFTTENPTIISGSHNLSQNASASNDENYLIIRGNTDLADIYGCEIMRLYDHYRFRFQTSTRQGKAKKKPPRLSIDSSWTDEYFEEGSLHALDRQRFSGS